MDTTRGPHMTLRKHLEMAEWHAQQALDLAAEKEPQSILFRFSLGRAQSILMSLCDNIRRFAKA